MIIRKGGLRLKNKIKKNDKFFPLVSIITVVRNGEKYLEQTIKSVLNQSYKNIEYLIIDGDSKDKTLKIIKICRFKNITFKIYHKSLESFFTN